MANNLQQQVNLTQSRVDDLLRKNLDFMSTPDSQSRKRGRHHSSPGSPESLLQPAKLIDPAISKYIDNKVETKVNEAVAVYIKLIKDQQQLLIAQQEQIRHLQNQLTSRSDTIPERPPAPALLQRLDDLEQYSRRNTLRLTGIKAEVPPGETTDNIVMNIAEEMGVTLNPSDIDRSHFNSPPDPSKGRELLVKFVRHTDKVRFISKRKQLKSKPESLHKNVFVNEDLTKTRYRLLRSLIKLKKIKQNLRRMDF